MLVEYANVGAAVVVGVVVVDGVGLAVVVLLVVGRPVEDTGLVQDEAGHLVGRDVVGLAELVQPALGRCFVGRGVVQRDVV